MPEEKRESKNGKKSGAADDMERIRRQLRKMAFGKANDCVKLVLHEAVDIESLDLSLLTEIKRSDKGTVEVKLVDRTRVLEQLASMAEGGEPKAEEFLQALLRGMNDGN